MTSDASGGAARPTVIYDGDCGFCRRCQAWIAPRVNVTWVRIVDWPDGATGLGRQALVASLHAVRDGQVTTGAAAVATTLGTSRSRAIRLAARILGPPGVSGFAELVYRWVAGHRPLLSRLVSWRPGPPDRPTGRS